MVHDASAATQLMHAHRPMVNTWLPGKKKGPRASARRSAQNHLTRRAPSGSSRIGGIRGAGGPRCRAIGFRRDPSKAGSCSPPSIGPSTIYLSDSLVAHRHAVPLLFLLAACAPRLVANLLRSFFTQEKKLWPPWRHGTQSKSAPEIVL